MAKWIELNNGELVNLDLISNVRKCLEISGNGNIYEIEFNGDYDAEETYTDEEERDKRFEEIKAMLIGSDKK